MIIGLCGITFCSVNYGVSALALSQIAVINECAQKMNIDVEYYIFSMDKQEEAERVCMSIGIPKIKVFESARFRRGISGLAELKKAISECDIVFDLTKGDSFSDIYGLKRFILQAVEKRFAIKYSKLVISPQTIGPFHNLLVKNEAGWALKHAISVFARDEQSARCVQELCPNINVITTSDLAFYLPYEKTEKSNVDGKTHLGINISGLLWNGGYTGKNEFGLRCDYQEYTRTLLKTLGQHEDYEITVFGHVYMERGDDDYAVCQQLASEFPNIILAPRFKTPIEAKNFMSKLDLVIGARMHATIGAISSGTPVIPFSYSRKFEGLFGTLGYQYVVEARKWNTEESVAFTEKCLRDLSQLNKDASKAAEKAIHKNQIYCDSILDLLRIEVEDVK